MKRTLPVLMTAALATTAHGQSLIDGVEHILGATNIHAITGHGRLTVGVSADGDVTVLTWPNPSQADQLAYITSNAFDARQQPRFGAPEGGGLFLGLVVERGGMRQVTWLRDRATWTIDQSYGAADGANVETRHAAAALGLTVTVTDAVRPAAPGDAGDAYVRRVRVERAPGSEVTAAWLLTYANLSPTPPGSRVPELPIGDWAFDGRDDFAAVWDASAGAVVHFHPGDRLVRSQLLDLVGAPMVDYGPIGEALRAGTAGADDQARLAAALDADYPAGAYLALTTQPPPDQHQVGLDATPWCAQVDLLIDDLMHLADHFPGLALPVDPALLNGVRCPRDAMSPAEREGWPSPPADALADAADGGLDGAGLAAGEVNEALRTPLAFGADGTATVTVVLGAGPDAATARAQVTAPADDVPEAAEAALAEWLTHVALPEHASPAVRTVARRALINVRVGTAENGAIVASVARQAPYGMDWPRDGAFFDVALDAAGLSDLVTRRADLYLSWQRQAPARPTPLLDPPPPADPSGGPAIYPAGAWEMNYYADGTPGGTWRFEIDNTGFALWGICAHAGWLPAEVRADYLRSRWEGIRAAADLLTRWRDPATGLPAPAQEDDNAAYTQTLHGAVTTAGALAMAARAARVAGEDADAERWGARAAEIRDAIVTHFYDADAGRFAGAPDAPLNPGSAPTGPTAWLVWPMEVLPWADPRVDAQLRADLDAITPAVELRAEGGAYFLKNLAAAAMARGADPAWRPRLAQMLEEVAAQATAGTHHFGEVMLVVDGHADQRVSTPHLWEGTLFYLTAMALEAPEKLRRYDELPPAAGPDAGAPDAGPADAATADATAPDAAPAPRSRHDDGCGCHASGAPAGPAVLLLLAALVRRRKAR